MSVMLCPLSTDYAELDRATFIDFVYLIFILSHSYPSCCEDVGAEESSRDKYTLH